MTTYTGFQRSPRSTSRVPWSLLAIAESVSEVSETLPSLPELGSLHRVAMEYEDSVETSRFQQYSTQDKIHAEKRLSTITEAKTAKPPRPSPLKLDLKGQNALSTSTKSSNSFSISTSSTTNSDYSGAYRSSNYFSPILKRRSLSWSGQRLAGIVETSAVGKVVQTSYSQDF